jgi:cytochrome c
MRRLANSLSLGERVGVRARDTRKGSAKGAFLSLGVRAAALASLGIALGAHADPAWHVPDAHPDRAPALMLAHGCAACHTIPGVEGADGNVGPPLARFGTRITIAGMLPNQPGHLLHWLRDPQSVVPGNVMPDTGLSEQDARDIAAYLYTLR